MTACTSVAVLDEQFFAIESFEQIIKLDLSYYLTARARAEISSIDGVTEIQIVLDVQEHFKTKFFPFGQQAVDVSQGL
jgi:hypothetical protein